jgi:hypothetical protein
MPAVVPAGLEPGLRRFRADRAQDRFSVTVVVGMLLPIVIVDTRSACPSRNDRDAHDGIERAGSKKSGQRNNAQPPMASAV